MEKNYQYNMNDSKFLSFISQEFTDTARNATVEELAEFAFGSVEDAIEAFKEAKKRGLVID